ncbi:hypothetical protein Tco_1527616 [Tanacetum coccineum]
MYEHVDPKFTRFTRWQSLQDGKTRLCLVDDLKVFKITFSHTSQDKGTSSSLKSMITTSIHKLMIEVKDYELKTNGLVTLVVQEFLQNNRSAHSGYLKHTQEEAAILRKIVEQGK